MSFLPDMLSILLLILLPKAAELTHNAAFAAAFMDNINAVRRTGCVCDGQHMPAVNSVIWHPKLEISASIHAQQMVKYRFFEHFSRGGMDIGERAKAVGYPWKTIGENLARGQVTIAEVIEDWQESPTHCRLLMNPKFKEMGAAHIGQYWVLHMGVRKEETANGQR